MKAKTNFQRLEKDYKEVTETAEGFVITRDENKLDNWTVTL